MENLLFLGVPILKHITVYMSQIAVLYLANNLQEFESLTSRAVLFKAGKVLS